MKKVYDPIKVEKSALFLEKPILMLYYLFLSFISISGIILILDIFFPYVIGKMIQMMINMGIKRLGIIGFYLSDGTPAIISRLPRYIKNIIATLCISSLINFSLITVLLKLLKNILHTIAEKTPFARANAKKIELIAFIIIGFNFVMPVIVYFISHKPIELFDYFSFTQWGPLIAGLALLLVSKVFRYGCYLQNEYDETL